MVKLKVIDSQIL